MRLMHGDCLEQLKTLADNSVDSLVTDPPAGIAFMGKEWDKDKGGRKEWVSWMTGVMSEALRVMKPGAHGQCGRSLARVTGRLRPLKTQALKCAT